MQVYITNISNRIVRLASATGRRLLHPGQASLFDDTDMDRAQVATFQTQGIVTVRAIPRRDVSASSTHGTVVVPLSAGEVVSDVPVPGGSQLPSPVLAYPGASGPATSGLAYLPACAGTPTGTPTVQTGAVPMVVDTSGGKIWIYAGDAWHYIPWV